MSRTIIRIEGLSKAFPVYTRPSDVVYDLILNKARHDVFWALRDVNITIAEGERVGIVGANGAGKSTLLKIITGNLAPTSGSVDVNGKLSSMLSLTSYLNDQQTGLDNIRFNLSLMGVDEREIPRLIEEVIDFTELGAFILAPVRTYSSGMNARLAFAISTAITPEILIVDEVLGVGDGYFVGKATERMVELCQRGRALLYVSHALSALQMLCTRAIWLDKGTVRMDGPVNEVLRAYEDDFRHHEDQATRSHNRKRAQERFGEATPEDFSEVSDHWRLRVMSDTSKPFRDVHYVDEVAVELAGKQMPVSLDLDADASIWLDILNSEWGRCYDHRGRPCRTLSALTGKRKGGHLLVRKPPAATGIVPVGVTLCYHSAAGLESLVIEHLDERTGEWQRLGSGCATKLPDDRLRLSVRGELPIGDDTSHKRTLEKLVRAQMADVAILSAHVEVGGGKAKLLRERQSFDIVVQAEVVRPVPILDFGIRIIRNDGVYVFWQSTGQSSGNVSAAPGRLEARFHFDPNHISAGSYQVTAYAANGWDIESNYPYSEVFDRRINIFDFRIMREFEKLDFGTINLRVPTSVNSLAEKSLGAD